MDDLISRQQAIDAVDSEVVSTNPEHFKSSEKFIKFMDDADIASFGKWQWANGFNTALVASKVQLEKLPPAQPERKEGHWIPHEGIDGDIQYECSECGVLWEFNDGTPEENEAYFCPKCGVRMRG